MDEEQPTPDPAPPPRSRSRLRIAVALTLVAAVVVLAAVQVSGLLGKQVAPTEASLPLRIAFVDGSGVLATMDERGGSVFRHPVDGVSFVFPAWSPDGSRIAAIGGRLNEDGGVYVFQGRGEGAADPATATDPAVIYRSADRPPFYLYWTPDGSQVTFLTTEPTGIALRVAPADGSSPGAILREGAPLYWDWISPSRALVNIGAGGPDAFLGEVGLDGQAAGPTAVAGAFRAPAVSRDGSQRAFVTAPGGSASIVIESLQGTDRHEIPVTGLPAIGFAPDGASLAFIAAPSSAPTGLPLGPLQLVDIASGSVRTLLDGLIVAFFWSPDGRTIATLRVPGPGEEDVASVGSDLPRVAFPPAATSSGYNLRLTFVDVATGSVRSTQAVRVAEMFVLQLLPYFDQYARSHRVWSADSASLLLPLVSDEGVDGLVVLPADGSEERRLADGELGFWSP